MKKLFVSLLILGCVSFQAAAADLKLDTKMVAAIKKYDAKFHILSMEDFAPTVRGYFDDGGFPMAYFSDFNSDQVQDVVVMGTTGKGLRIVLSVVSAGKTYKVQRVDELEFKDPRTAKYGDEKGLSQFISASEDDSSAFLWNTPISLSFPVIVFVWNGQKFVAK